MAEIAARYNRLAADFRAVAESVPPGRWEDPSPCDGWTARDVARHVVEAHRMQLGFLGAAPAEPTSTDHDPVAALSSVEEPVAAALADPDEALRVIDGVTGEMTFAESIDRFLSFDLLIHRWDLAQAVGLTVDFPRDDVRWARQVADGLGDMLRAEGIFGPAQPVSPDADAQAQLLAHLGRRPE